MELQSGRSAVDDAGGTAATESARLLIVDDDPAIRVVAGSLLREAGYEVTEAACAEDGLAAFDAQPFDGVLLDVLLPGLDGFAACRRLQSLAKGAALPILMMTGLDDRESIARAYECGATDFMTKPIEWALLPYRVRYALRSSRALRETVRAGALLARSQQLAQMGSWEWVCATDRVHCSQELDRIHGTSTAADAGGPAQPDSRGIDGLLSCVHADDRDMLQQVLAFAQTEGQPYGVELRIVRPDGELRRVFEQTDVERDAGGGIVAVRGIRRDITQQVEADNRIRTLAYFDALTGLGNRALFSETTQQWLAFAERRGLQSALLFINLDRFKVINETLGPAIGDALLKALGDRLRDCVRGGDVKGALRGTGSADGFLCGGGPGPRGGGDGENLPARLGGDEFTVLLVDVDNREGAALAARRIMHSLASPLRVAGHELTVTVSIGIAMAPADGADLDALLRNASTAMHVAKESGRDQMRFYAESMSADLRRRLTLENDLRRALEHGELSVHYQAKVDARDADVIGAEALLRWQHPTRGAVRPTEFIPVAEESGLIVPITEWVIATVCRQLAAWRAAGVPVVPVSVNLDGKSMQSERLLDTVVEAMAASGVGPRELEFEVTESGLMRDLNRASTVLARLKAIGLKLSIDDFGTGYSSLTYLKRFPVDVLKIDRSFVKDLLTDANDAALTAAIIAMGLSLKLELVAEGVETWAQADFLMDRGCHRVQGFLFARPLASDAFAALLRSGVPKRRTLQAG